MRLQRGIAMLVLGSSFVILAARADEPGETVAKEEFDRRYIGFDEFGGFDPKTGVFYKVTDAYEGKYKIPLAPAEFFRTVGRDDLAQEYTARESRRNAAMVTGALIGLGSLLATVVIISNATSGDCNMSNATAFGQCVSEQSSRSQSGFLTGGAVGLGGLLLGGAIYFAGASTNPNPLDAYQMRELADGYNQRLKQRLGISMLPVLTPDAAGLALNMPF
jgi:hypothetical protein